MNIHDTLYMLAAVEELTPEPTFFKRRYFPTDTAMIVPPADETVISCRPLFVPKTSSPWTSVKDVFDKAQEGKE